jgi:hypothetical protein
MNLNKLVETHKGQDNIISNRMPHHDIDPKKKEEMSYYVSVMKHLFTLGANGMLHTGGLLNGIINGGNSKYSTLRSYAKGQTNTDKYKEQLLGKDSKGNQRKKSYMNISWEQDRGHVNLRDQILGIYDKMDYDVAVRAVDPASQYKRKKEIAALKIWQNQTFKNFIGSLGVDFKQPEQQFESEQDVDLFVKTGGLKLQEEIKLQKALNVTNTESKWRMLKYMLFADLFDIGIVAVKDYIDHSINTPILRYVDPDMLLLPCSKYLDFRDITMAAEIRQMTIAEIRNESKLQEKHLMMIAKEYGFNNAFASVQHTQCYNENGYYPYDHIKVWVLDGCWLSSDVRKFREKNIEKYGTLDFSEKPYDYKLDKSEEARGAKLIEKRVQYQYECKWIIGTDFAFGCDKNDNTPRQGKTGYKKGILSYHVATTGVTSKVERMVPDIDMINILTYKRRNAIAAIPAPPAMIFNKSALENTELDGEIKTPTDLMNMLLEKGIMSLDTVDSHGNPIANIHSLVAPIQSNAFEQFKIFSDGINEHRNNISINTGMNDVANGSTDSERMLKVQGEAKLEAANNSIQPEYAAMRELSEAAYTSSMLRWQQICKDGEIDIEYHPLHEDDIEIIKLTEDIAGIKFNLKVTLSSNYQEKQFLLQQLIGLTQQRAKFGYGGITEDVYIGLYRVIMAGNIPLAQLMLGKSVKEQEVKDQERKQQDIQANGEQQRMSAQLAQEEARKTIVTKAAMDMSLAHNQFVYDANLKAIEADLEDGVLENEALRQQVGLISQGIKPSMDELMKYLNTAMEQPQQQA